MEGGDFWNFLICDHFPKYGGLSNKITVSIVDNPLKWASNVCKHGGLSLPGELAMYISMVDYPVRRGVGKIILNFWYLVMFCMVHPL